MGTCLHENEQNTRAPNEENLAYGHILSVASKKTPYISVED